MREDFRQHADLEVPVGAVDARELADAIGIVDDVAHVGLPLVRSGRGFAATSGFSMLSRLSYLRHPDALTRVSMRPDGAAARFTGRRPSRLASPHLR